MKMFSITNKYKIIYFFLVLIAIIHFLFLHCLGISAFTTTLLFYLFIYLVINLLINYIVKNETGKIILHNLKVIFILMLITEFSCTFIFKYMNNYMENDRGVYFSLFMRNKQVDFFHQSGRLRARNDWNQAYEPNTTHPHQSKDFNYLVKTNSLGFRGTLPPVKKDSNEFRIAVIGDSFIEGFGTDEQHTFTVLLEKYLAKTNKKITVINGGICGSNPVYEINIYRNLLQPFQPDLVLAEINLSDLDDYEKASHQGRMPLSEYLKAISHIFRILDQILQISKTDNGTGKTETILSKNIIQTLSAFREELKATRQQLVVIYLPTRSEVASKEISALNAELYKSDLEFIDLTKYYKEVMPNNFKSLKTYYWENDGHHNPTGYDVMAKTVATQLLERAYIKTE